MNAADLTPDQREALKLDAMLHEAPDVPGLVTRPFNDAVLGLCAQVGLSLFTLEAFGGDFDKMQERATSLGYAELNRQCLCLLYLVGFPDVKAMCRATRDPDFYEAHVLPWALELPHDPARMSQLLGEWQRYTLHSLAAVVKVLPREGDSPGFEPPNS